MAKAKDDLQVASKPSSELPCERSSEVHTQRKSIGDMETKVKLLEDQLISTKVCLCVCVCVCVCVVCVCVCV